MEYRISAFHHGHKQTMSNNLCEKVQLSANEMIEHASNYRHCISPRISQCSVAFDFITKH